jgi:hypothetical protein
MTAIDRTAYPRPGTRLTREELSARYDLTETDLALIRASARGGSGRLVLATRLKTRQDVGYFAAPAAAHPPIVDHLAAHLGITAPQSWADEIGRTK